MSSLWPTTNPEAELMLTLLVEPHWFSRLRSKQLSRFFQTVWLREKSGGIASGMTDWVIIGDTFEPLVWLIFFFQLVQWSVYKAILSMLTEPPSCPEPETPPPPPLSDGP